MDKYDIDLSPSTFKKVKDIASKRNISYEDVIREAIDFYCKHQQAYFQGQEVIVVFDDPNLPIENLINKFWDSEFTKNHERIS